MNATITSKLWASLFKKLNSDVKLAGFLFVLIASCGCDGGAPSGKQPEVPIQRSNSAVQPFAKPLVAKPHASHFSRNRFLGPLADIAFGAFNYLMGTAPAAKKLDLGVGVATPITITDQGTNTQQLLRAFGMKPLPSSK
jgi:hypothetical protein